MIKNPFITILFALLALPTLFLTVFLLPPFQGADEIAHFMRAEQVASGDWIGEKIGTSSGGYISSSIIKASVTVSSLPFHPENKLTTEIISQFRHIKLRSEKVFASFPNTVTYSPFFYLPSAIGIGLAKFIDTSVVNALIFARLLNGLCCIAISCLALYILQSGKHFMYAILSLPMSLALFGVVTPDGLVIASTGLIVALLTNLNNRSLIPNNYLLLLLLVLLCCIVSTKIAYIPFAFLLLVPSLLRHIGLKKAALCFCFVLVSEFLWIKFGMIPVSVPLLHDGYNISSSDQLFYVITNPIANLALLSNTINTFATFYLHSFIGILGWLDLSFRPGVYLYYSIFLVLALIFDLLFGARNLSSRLDKIAVCLIALASFLCIMYALYLAWSPVGSPIILGVQGRYFIPVALLISLILTRLSFEIRFNKIADKIFYLLSFPVIFILGHALYLRYLG